MHIHGNEDGHWGRKCQERGERGSAVALAGTFCCCSSTVIAAPRPALVIAAPHACPLPRPAVQASCWPDKGCRLSRWMRFATTPLM